MKKFLTLLLFLTVTFNLNAQEGRNISEYNLNSVGTGFINGNKANALAFDPTSVFVEGGGSLLEGDQAFALTHDGVEYLFGNALNMKAFLTNPEKFEPTYGGWCARAMVVGQKVHINTKLFTVVGNRSFFFVNKRAKRFFDRDVVGNAKKADKSWKSISGEEPRL